MEKQCLTLGNHTTSLRVFFLLIFVQKYLEVLGCPFAFGRNLTDVQMATVIEWMLNYALSLKFQKKSTDYNISSALAVERIKANALAKQMSSARDETKAFVSCVRELAKKCNIPHDFPDSEASNALLACVRQAVRTVLRKRLNEEEKEEEKGAEEQKRGGKSKTVMDLESEEFALGFDTGNKDLNDTGKVLRLLYSEDLRQLQSRINALLVLIQNITANPKIDAKLGMASPSFVLCLFF